MLSLGSNLYAGTGGGVFKSSNNGVNWTASSSGLTNLLIYALSNSDTSIIAGTYGGGIFVSHNGGANWIQRNQGLGNLYLRSILVTGNYVFVGTSGSSVWRRLKNEVMEVKSISTEVPDRYNLSQNYPNPFNPSTNIKFQIKENTFVVLKVYDMLGKEISTLVNEKLEAGTYQVDFTGYQIPSGTYFYRLEAGNYIETKKMTLIK